MKYVMTWALFSNPFELYRFPQRIGSLCSCICRCICGGAPPEDTTEKVENFDFALQYALLLHVVSLICFFSTMAPLILLFGVVYLALKHAVDRFLLVCIHPRSSRLGVAQASAAMDLYIVCILLSQLGTACLLISRAVTDEDDTKTASVTMFAVFWVTFALYTCMKLAQSTATAVRKRNLVPAHLRSVMDGQWFDRVSPEEAEHVATEDTLPGEARMSVDLTEVKLDDRPRSNSEHAETATLAAGGLVDADGDHVLAEDEEAAFTGAYCHPYLELYEDGLNSTSPQVHTRVNVDSKVAALLPAAVTPARPESRV